MKHTENSERYIRYMMILIALALIGFGGYLLIANASARLQALQFIAMGVIVFGISPGIFSRK